MEPDVAASEHRQRLLDEAILRSKVPRPLIELLAQLWRAARELSTNVEDSLRYGRRDLTPDQQRYPSFGDLIERRELADRLLECNYEQLFGVKAAADVRELLRLERADRRQSGDYIVVRNRLNAYLGSELTVLSGRIRLANEVLRSEQKYQKVRRQLTRPKQVPSR